MKYIEKNISKIVVIFLIIQPLIDVITGISIYYFKLNLTFGMFFRTLFLILCCFYILFIYQSNNKKKIYLYFLILLIYSILYLFNCYSVKELTLLNITNLLKAIYIPILIIFFYVLYNDKKLKISKSFLGKMSIIYLLFIFVPNILGIGIRTYEVTKKGNIGFFYTANEISGIISILMPFFLLYIYKLKQNILKIILSIMFLYILFSMGTKGPILSLGIIAFYFFIKQTIIYFKNKEYKKLGIIFSLIIVLIGSLIIIIPKTTFYDNLQVHLKFLHVDSPDDLINAKKIDHFIFSERFKFLEKTNKLYQEKNVSTKLLGMSYTENNVEIKTIEMDYLDIFYHQGIIGFIIILFPYIILIVKIVKDYFKYNKKTKVEIYMLSFILSILLSNFTGHVILSTNVLIFVALIMNMFYNEVRVVRYEK